MRYGSVCSGVEAASLAWEPLGWVPAFFSEIERFPSAVLARRWPDVPNLGDLTRIDGAAWRDRVDVLVGGTPCQAFSVAGLRRSLDDERGNLTLRFVELLHAIDPWAVVWENVPGVLSTPDNAFGCFLAGMVGADAPLVPPYGLRWTDAGMAAGPVRSAAWRKLDAQYVRLAQRRERVFVVSFRTRDGLNPGAVLFEPESVRRDSPPRREAGERVARPAAGSSPSSSGYRNDADRADDPLAQTLLGEGHDRGRSDGAQLVPIGFDITTATKTARALLSPRQGHGGGGRFDLETETMVLDQAPQPYTLHAANSSAMVGAGVAKAAFATDVARALDRNGGLAAGQGGTVVALAQNSRSEVRLVGEDGGVVGAVSADVGAQQQTYVAHPIAFHNRQDPDVSGDVSHPLGAKDNGMGVAFSTKLHNTQSNQAGKLYENYTPGLDSNSPPPALVSTMAVRRLTPRECERLQGMPDDHTRIPWRGRPVELCPDGPRYRAIGNSMAVTVMHWIGVRLQLVREARP